MAFFNNKRKDFSIQPPRQQVDGTPFFVTDSANIDFTLENLNLTANLTPTGVTSGTYGSATLIPILQVDQWGRITGVTTTPFSASGISLETNGTPNPVQTLLNLVAGTNMTITDDGLGNITFDATGGGATYTVDNGLTENPANNFQLGGTLIQDTTIDINSYRLSLTGTSAIPFSSVNTSTGVGAYFQADDNNAIVAYSPGGRPAANFLSLGSRALLVQNRVNGATTEELADFDRLLVSGSAGVGTGGYINIRIPRGTPTIATDAIRFLGKWSSVASIFDANFELWTTTANSLSRKFQILPTGQGVLDLYGSGTFTGTLAYALGVNSFGDVIEYTPTSGGGGGGGRSYYLNGSVIQGTFGGIVDMREMSPVPVIGAGTDFTINTNGYIKSFITDAGDPNKAVIPAGNWNFELWFSVNNPGGSPNFYVELSKYDGATFTPIATGVANPTNITTTATTLYITALAVPQTTLLLTDRLAVRVFVNHGGGSRVVTLHTQGPHLSQIITDFPSGINSLNGLTAFIQNFATPGTSGIAPNWSSALDSHTLNIPLASVASVTAGLISRAEYDTFNGKQDALTTTKSVKISTNNVELDGDETTPAANKYYGTDSGGIKGFHSLPTSTGSVISFRKVYGVNQTYITSMVYYNSILYFGSFYVGGSTGGTQIYNATTGAFSFTSVFTEVLFNRRVTNGATEEVWTISNGQTSIQRLNALTGALILNSTPTGAVTTAARTRFCQFSSTKVFFGNSTNYFCLDPTSFITTSSTLHLLGNIPYVAVNNNVSSAQNGYIMMGSTNGIMLINGSTNAVALAATTLSGAVGNVYDIQYDATNDNWIIATLVGTSFRLVYLTPLTTTTFTVTKVIYAVSTLGATLVGGTSIFCKLLLDETNNYLFFVMNHRITQIQLSTGDIIQSHPFQSTGPAAGQGVFTAADIDTANKTIYAVSGGSATSSFYATNEILYT
jgi:hypothetical protein